MKRISVTMVRENLLDIPQYSLPDGYRLRLFTGGDETNWAKIETEVGEFGNEQLALTRFNGEFGPHMDEIMKRCLFMVNEDGETIATTTAWYGDLHGQGEMLGRIHWVGVVPTYQGRKLSKPLLSVAMNILAEHHSKAYLTSQTTSYQAIQLYINYGFKPLLTSPSCDEAWDMIGKILNKKLIGGENND